MKERLVERNPHTPALDLETVDLLTQVCFRQDNAFEPVDLVFFFSSFHGGVEVIQEVISSGITDKVFIGGGYLHGIEDRISKPEADLVLEKINQAEYPGVTFFGERVSTNTYENVTEALKVLNFRNYEKILFICKAHVGGRDYLTLRKFCPYAVLLQKTYSVMYSEDGATDFLTRANWHETEFGRSRVWGEFMRIIKYGKEMGMIEYDEIEEKVEKILKNV